MLLYFGILLVFKLCIASEVISVAENDATLKNTCEMCSIACDKTYPLHTYPSADHLKCCKRGCRFYVLIHLVYSVQDFSSTKDLCLKACKEAYNNTSECYACTVGCNSQMPAFTNDQTEVDNFLYGPVLYIQTVYKKLSGLMMSKWAIYISDSSGSASVVESSVKDYFEDEDFDTHNALAYQTSYPEKIEHNPEEELSVSSTCLFDFLHFIVFKVIVIFISFLIILALLTLMRIAVFESIEKKFHKLSLVEQSEYLLDDPMLRNQSNESTKKILSFT